MKILLVHGGAGRITGDQGPRLRELAEACRYGFEHDDPIDMVVEAVVYMEDTGLFNAGLGSALNLQGEREMDAGIMASNRKPGAVAAVRYPRNPVRLARIVMEETDHIIIAGSGADTLAKRLGLEEAQPPPQHILERYKTLLEEYRRGAQQYYQGNRGIIEKAGLLDTVGAAALHDGDLAAATSTGGVWLKLPGRVGDTPIPGAGFLATPRMAGSSTGLGEAIIMAQPLYRLDHLLSKGYKLHEALEELSSQLPEEAGNAIGLIAVTRRGEAYAYYNTQAMLTGWCTREGAKALLLKHPGRDIVRLA